VRTLRDIEAEIFEHGERDAAADEDDGFEGQRLVRVLLGVVEEEAEG
jgi:hypothetical protein